MSPDPQGRAGPSNQEAPLHLVLFEPRIPQNTGTIGRLCVATATPLHLIEPLGFSLADRYLKRAGLDYWPEVRLTVWPDLAAYLEVHPERRMVASSARRGEPYHRFPFAKGDSLLLGPEDTGLPKEVWSRFPDRITIPFWGPVRSLNLANSAAVLAYRFFERIGGLDDYPG